jgi:hypothetical protein
VHTAGFFMAFEAGILESKVSYTIEDSTDDATEDWVKVYKSVIRNLKAI